jgi:hypothetical protein
MSEQPQQSQSNA